MCSPIPHPSSPLPLLTSYPLSRFDPNVNSMEDIQRLLTYSPLNPLPTSYPLSRFDPNVNSMEDLKRLLTYSRRFVQTVRLRQLPSHMDLTVIFDCMVK